MINCSGGAYNDLIEGGDGFDFITGGPGNDHLEGGPRDDLIFGDGTESVVPDRHEWVPITGSSRPNDTILFATPVELENLDSNEIQGTLHLNDRGDWYRVVSSIDLISNPPVVEPIRKISDSEDLHLEHLTVREDADSYLVHVVNPNLFSITRPNVQVLALGDAPADGRLSGDATFEISIDGRVPLPVTIFEAFTADNPSQPDPIDALVQDMNNYFLAHKDINGDVAAGRIGNRLILSRGFPGIVEILNPNAVTLEELKFTDQHTTDITPEFGEYRLTFPESEGASNSIPHQIFAEVFSYGLAAPLHDEILHISERPEFSMDTEDFTIDGQMSLSGEYQYRQLQHVQDIGDINNDGFSDLLLSDRIQSYILFGPIDDFRNEGVSVSTDIHVDHSLGKPASLMGDIDGNGIDDLIFYRNVDTNRVEGGHRILATQVNIIFDREPADGPWSQTLHMKDVDKTVIIEHTETDSYPDNSGEVSVLDWDADGYDDLLLVTGWRDNPTVGDASTAYIISGSTVYNTDGPLFTDEGYPVVDTFDGEGILAKITGEEGLKGIPAGDVNGDALEDILLWLPNDRYAYMYAGRKLPVDRIPFHDYAARFRGIDDISQRVGTGDIDGDGIGDVAIATSNDTGENSVFLYFGDSSYLAGKGIRPTKDISLSTSKLGSIGSAPTGSLNVTSGDFNGDGSNDLAVGMVNHYEARGQVRIFWSIVEKWPEEDQTTITGSEFDDGFGTLPVEGYLDLDADGYDDLLIGAPFADVDYFRSAGALYSLYGAPQVDDLSNKVPTVISNRTITGSGNYIVEIGPGQIETFNDTLNENKQEGWYRVTSLGDGRSGNQIQISPKPENADGAYVFPDEGTLIQSGDQISIDTTGNYRPVKAGGEPHVAVLEFDLSHYLEDRDLIGSVLFQLDLLDTPSSGNLSVSILSDGGDGAINSADFKAEAEDTRTFTLTGERLQIDISGLENVIRERLIAGHTRLTMRIEGTNTTELHIPGRATGAGSRLVVLLDERPGVQADVYHDLGDGSAALIARGKSIVDMRKLEAGSYLLHVYRPAESDPLTPGPVTEPLDFTIEIGSPAAGVTHPQEDRDEIRGGATVRTFSSGTHTLTGCSATSALTPFNPKFSKYEIESPTKVFFHRRRVKS